MRQKPTENLEKCRVRQGQFGSDETFGNNGAFVVRSPRCTKLIIIASDGMGWEHVSVHIDGKNRCPYWDEMCYVKSLFWGPEEAIVQFHPAESEYVNNHPYTLHLWKPVGEIVQTPPEILIGIKAAGKLK